MKWTEIEQSEKWASLTPQQRRLARERYFDEFVAPQAPEDFDPADLRARWMAYSDRDEASRQPGSVGPRSRGGERNPMTAEDALVSQAQNAVGRGVPVAEVKDRIRDMDSFSKGDRPFDDMSARARSPRGGKPMGYVSSQREIDEATIPADELMRRDQSKYEAETTFGDRLRNRVDQGFAQAETGLASLPMNAAVDRLQELERTGDVVLSWRNDMPQYASDVFKGDAWEDFKRRTREEAQGATADFAASTAMRNRYTASLPQSPARQYAQKTGDWKGGFLADPLGYSADAAVPSAVAMAPALAVAGVARNPVAGASIMGLTGFTNERAGSMVEYLAEQGIDTSNEDAIRKALSNPEIFNAADKYATTRAAIIAPIDAVGAGLASRTIAPGVRGFLRREAVNTLVGQPVTQAAIGGAGEAAAGLATKGRISGVDVFDEVLGEVAMSPAETAPYAIDRVRNGGSDVIGNMSNDSLRDVANNANATRGERMSALMELAARGDTADVRPDTPVGRGAAAAESILKATKPAVAPMPTGANIGLAVPPSSSAPDDDAKLGQLLAGTTLKAAKDAFASDPDTDRAAAAQRAADAFGVPVDQVFGGSNAQGPNRGAGAGELDSGNQPGASGASDAANRAVGRGRGADGVPAGRAGDDGLPQRIEELTAEDFDAARRDLRRSEVRDRASSGQPVEQTVPQQPQVSVTLEPDSLRSRRDAARARNDFNAYLQESGQTADDLAAASAYDGDRIPQPSGEPVAVGPSRISGQGIIATDRVTKPVTLFDLSADGPVRTDAGRYVNHSPQPNADVKIVQGRIVAVPNREIQPGQEVTINYREIDPLREQLATRQYVPDPTPVDVPDFKAIAESDPDKAPESFGLPKPMVPRGKKRTGQDFDENYDDALDFLALNGGLDRVAWKSQGVDPDMLTRKKGNEWNKRFAANGPTLFPARGGMTPDQAREMLQQRGFFAQDVDGSGTEANDAIDLVMESLNQGRVFRTPAGADVAQRRENIRRMADSAARDLDIMRDGEVSPRDIVDANDWDNRERVMFSQAEGIESSEISQDEFDSLMREQRARMTERENDRMVSLAPDEFTRSVWQRLSEIPELTQNPKIAGSTPSEVVAAAKMGAELTGITSGSDESGPHQVHYFKLPDRIVERDGRRVTDKGGVFAVKVYKNAVEVNVSDLKPGESGSRIYNAVAGLADSTGKLFRGDTQGLSDWAILRRTENMVSNALKYGADTVAPHPRQTSPGGKMSWAAPLKWTPDPEKNLTNLLLTSAENVARLLPEIDNYTYNWQAKRFEDANGNAVTDAEFRELSKRAGQALRERGVDPRERAGSSGQDADGRTGGMAPATPYGRDSIARAILTRSLVRSTGSEGRGQVLAATGAQRAELSLDEALRGITYSQPTRVPNQSDATRGRNPAAVAGAETRPSGIPKSAPSQKSMVTTKLGNRLRDFGINADFERVALPDALASTLDALGRITGRNVVVFRVTKGKFNANGFVLPGDPNIYVNADSESPVLTVASHEFLHQLRKDRPDLYSFIAAEVEKRADMQAWREELDQRPLTRGKNRVTDDALLEELVADGLGDSLSDPQFLASLAKRNPTKFRDFVMKALDYFSGLLRKIGRMKSLGSFDYLTDISGLRDAYAQMLEDYDAGVMPDESEGVIQFQSAWHGTPHKVDRFRLDKIGTGEGAQAYGWGLYFAGNKEVAEYYRDALASSVKIRDMQFNPDGTPNRVAQAAFQIDSGIANEDVVDGLEVLGYSNEDARQIVRDAQKLFNDLDKGQLYKVDIPEDDTYLLWDKPLSEQPEKVREALKSLYSELKIVAASNTQVRFDKLALAIADGDISGQQLYHQATDLAGTPQILSKILGSIGIPGLRYLDGNSRSKGEGSYNYVIWDESAIGEPQAQFSQAAGGDSVGGMQEDDYRGEHGAPMSDSGAPAHDVTGGGNYYPDDVYSANGMRYYGDGSAHDAESFSIIRRLKGRPNADVKIYRAVPKVKTKADLIADVDAEMARIQRRGGTPGRYDWLSDERDRLLRLPDDAPAKKIGINRGDWVSITRGYAVDHGRGALGGEYRIVSKTVKARDIFTNGDSIHEWGYDPQDGTSRNSDTDPQFSQPSTDITTTPEFERWFGESKVVDADGKPLVVYHGSSRDIESFAAGADEAGQSNGNRTGAWGSYFTPSAAEASIYAEMAGGDSPQNVVPVYLAIRNPYVMNRAEWGKHSQRTAKAATSAEGRADAKAVRAGIEALGHDGIVIRDRGFNDEWVAFRPEQIKSVNNRGTFDPNDPRILFSQPKTPAQAAAENAQKRATVATATGAQQPVTFTYTDRFEGQIRGRLNRLREGAQDKMLSALFVQEDIEAARGAIADAVNVYRRENLMHGRTGDQLETLKRTHVDPLVKAMKAEGLDDAVVEDYLEAKFAPERNKIIAAKNPNMPDGGSGMTDAEAADFLAGKTDGFRSGRKITPADTAKLQRIATKIQALRAETLDRLESSGLINAQAKAAMLAQAPNYVPLRGKDGAEIGSGRGGAGKGIDVRGSSIKEALGRGAGNRAVNILAEMIADAERSIVQAEKNRVGKTLARLVLENPNPDLWEVEPVRLEQKLDSVGQVYQAVQSNAQDQDAIRIMHDGKAYFVRLADPKLRDAMKNLGVDNSGAVIKFMGGINRYFSAVLTRYNPSFIAVNAFRDLGFGMTGIAAEHGMRVAGSAAAKYPAAMRAMWRDNRGTLKNTAMDRYAREFSEAGGKTFFAKRDSVEEISSRVAAEFKSYGKLLRRGQVGLAWNKAVNNSALLKVVNDANDAVENAMRLSAYAALRESGKSVEQAAEYAKNITVNFNRKGQVATAANAVILFYNAATQGAHRSIKLLRNPKVIAAMGGLAGLQALLAAYAMGSDDEDDDGLTAWEKIPAYEKERNLIIPIVGVDAKGNRRIRMVKWPMPYGFNVFSYAGGRMAELAMTKEPKPAKFANDMGNAVVNAFSPVKFIDGMDGIKPHFMKIFDALGKNEDDLGMPIRVSDDFDKFDKPRAYSGKADTPEAYKAIAKGLNAMGGGDEVTPPKMFAGLLDWAPEDLEYLTEQLTGGLGRFASDSYGAGEKLFAGIDTKPTDYPVLRSLVGEVDQNRATQGAYREREDEIEREVERVRRTIYAGREKVGEGRYTLDVEAKKKADDLMRNTPELDGYQIRRLKNGSIFDKSGAVEFEAKRGLAKSYKDAKKEVDRIKAEIRAAQAQTFPSLKAKSDRIKELQAQREKAQREFNEAFAKRER